MPTVQELLPLLLWPAGVALVVALLGWWRRWTWAMPLAAGTAFMAGVAQVGVPRLPPIDGTDWLFWLAVPLAAAGAVDGCLRKSWGWALGLLAGAVVLVLVRPLWPHSVTTGEMVWSAIAIGVVAAGVCFLLHVAETRIGSVATVLVLSIALAGTGVIAMSSGIRVVGLYGLSAAAALGAVAFVSWRTPAGRSVAIFAISLMAGMLTGARFYPMPPLAWMHLGLILVAPALAAAGVLVPGKRTWPRVLVALAAVSILIGSVATPLALKAKREAERQKDDPFWYLSN